MSFLGWAVLFSVAYFVGYWRGCVVTRRVLQYGHRDDRG